MFDVGRSFPLSPCSFSMDISKLAISSTRLSAGRRPSLVRIVVLVKHVPSAVGVVSFAGDRTVDRTGPRSRINEVDECAVGQALRIAPWRHDVRITAVSMGPSDAAATVGRALVLGADEGVHVLDDRLHGSDALATSRVLAAVVARLGFDLVLCGCASADSGMSAVPPMVAERLGVAALCGADAVRAHEGRIEISRFDHAGWETFAADLPAVVSVTGCCGEPRYPRFSAIAAARHKRVRTWSLDDLGIDAADVGLAASATLMRTVSRQDDARPRAIVTGDPCSAAVRVADFLVDRQFL
jgi:electron transfer flavoprotein beta subunit